MGFGYLLIGYLMAFVLYITANALSVVLGTAVLLLGYTAMLLGLLELQKYCRSFRWSALFVSLLILTGIWQLLGDLSELFLWNISFTGGVAGTVMDWCNFAFIMFFHAAILSSIRELATGVDLPKIANAALRNSIFVLVYGILYVIVHLQIADTVAKYFSLFMILCLVVYKAFNLLLFLSCTKNICPAGKEEIQVKRYKWNLLNRIGDKFAKTQENAVQRSRQDVENYLKKKQEQRELKNQPKRKRK